MADLVAAMDQMARGTLLERLGVRLVSVTEGGAIAQMDHGPGLTQLTGLLHSGALVTLADSAATVACMHAVDPSGDLRPERFPLAVQLSVNLMRNVSAGRVAAEARLVHRGRTTLVAETTVRDEAGRTLALVTSTHLVLSGDLAAAPDSPNPIVAELALLPERVATLLDGRSEEELRRRPAPDAWSAKEIACHLRDASRIYHERLFLTATHERPFLPGYDEAELARGRSYQEAPGAEIVPALRTWREETVNLLTDLPADAWHRPAIHGELGVITLLQITAHMVEHEADHLRGLALALGVDPPFGGA